MDNKIAANNLVSIIKEIVQQEQSSLDTTILGRIVEANSDGTFNVYVEPDEVTVIKSLPSIVTAPLNVGDYVYIYKIKNQLNNSFILKKINDTNILKSDIETSILELQNQITSVDNQVNNAGGGTTIINNTYNSRKEIYNDNNVNLYAHEEDDLWIAEILGIPTNFALSNDTLSWDSVMNATYYNIYVDGSYTVQITSTSYSLSSLLLSNASHTVQVLAGADNYINSGLTSVLTIYPITLTLTNVTKTSGATYISTTGTENIILTANIDYDLPSSVIVTGANYIWDSSAGQLTLSNTTRSVEVTVIGVEPSYIIFSSTRSFTLSTYNSLRGWNGALYYSTNKTSWNVWNGGTITAVLTNSTYNLYLRGTGNTYITGNWYPSYADHRFVLNGSSISCSGNIENLLDYETVVAGNHPTMNTTCFHSLFYNCTELISAPELRATTLVNYCYTSMFHGCTSLVTPPSLSATSLAAYCYTSMFHGCTSLTQITALPATTLANDCYYLMFYGCTLIKLSSTQDTTYTTAFRIPTSSTGTSATDALTFMFTSTGGTFTATPTINTTYYTSNTIV